LSLFTAEITPLTLRYTLSQNSGSAHSQSQTTFANSSGEQMSKCHGWTGGMGGT